MYPLADREKLTSPSGKIIAIKGLGGFLLAGDTKVVDRGSADKVLAKMKQNQYGREAAIIGEVVNEHPGRVAMKTRLGASRIVDVLVGELLPRIC